jgi:WD40 repeat protein
VHVAFTPDASSIVVGGGERVLLLDTATGIATTRDVVADVPSTVAYHDPLIRAVRIDPSGKSVAVTSVDGRLRILSIPDLAPLGVEWEVGTSVAYEYCYCIPFVASPIAWSADGALLATLDEDRNVAVRRACDATVVATLDNAAGEVPLSRADTVGPLDFAFSPDDSLLVVRYESHVEAHRVTRFE